MEHHVVTGEPAQPHAEDLPIAVEEIDAEQVRVGQEPLDARLEADARLLDEHAERLRERIRELIPLLCLALVFSQIRVAKTIANFKPLVIRIDQIGKAEAIRYDDLTYTPREAEIQYFLAQFVRLYYSRNRQSLAANFSSALVFLEPQLAESIVQAWERQRVVEDYARSNLGDIDISVKAVSITTLEKPPYQATVDYEQIYYAPRERTETKRVLYTAHFTFTFHGGVLPTAVLAKNPLGLVIQYFKEDAAIEPAASAGN